MTRVKVDAFETQGATSDVWIRNSTHSNGGYYSAASGLTVGSAVSANVNFSAGTASANLGSVVFSNSNGVSFGLNASTITASYTVPSTAGLLSAVNVSAGTTSNNLSAVTFSNLNGVSFGLNGSVVTASVAAPGGGGSLSVSAGTSSAALDSVVFADGNGVSFGLNGSTVTASHNGLTSQSNQAVSAANGSFTFQTVSFANSNGVSFSTGTQGLYASHNGVTSQSNQQLSMYAVGNTTQSSSGTQGAANLSFRGEGVASVGVSGGSVVISVPAGGGVAFADGVTTESPSTLLFTSGGNVSFSIESGSRIRAYGSINISAGTENNARANFVFSNSNGVSFGLNGGTVTASVNAGGGGSLNLSAGTTSNNLTAVTFSNANGISFGLNGSVVTASHAALTTNTHNAYAGGNTIAGVSTSGTFGNTVSFIGLQNASVGVQGNTVYVQAMNPVFSAGTASVQVGAGSSIVFSNAGGVSFGLNGSTITASVNAGGAAGSISYWANDYGQVAITSQFNSGNAILSFFPAEIPSALVLDRAWLGESVSNATNSSGSHSVSLLIGWYSQTGTNGIASVYTMSRGFAYTLSGTATTAGGYSGISGARLWSITGGTTTLSAGQWWIGILHRTSSAGANATYLPLVYTGPGLSIRMVGVANPTPLMEGRGVYSQTTSALPSAVSFNDVGIYTATSLGATGAYRSPFLRVGYGR